MVRSFVSRFAPVALALTVAACGAAPEDAAREDASLDAEEVASSEEALGGAVLDMTTVSQGGRGSAHAHHCYLAACTTVFNYLTKANVSMDTAWARTGQTMPPTDRVRSTFTRLGLPTTLGYMAAEYPYRPILVLANRANLLYL